MNMKREGDHDRQEHDQSYPLSSSQWTFVVHSFRIRHYEFSSLLTGIEFRQVDFQFATSTRSKKLTAPMHKTAVATPTIKRALVLGIGPDKIRQRRT